jgi:hypothetical protein
MVEILLNHLLIENESDDACFFALSDIHFSPFQQMLVASLIQFSADEFSTT